MRVFEENENLFFSANKKATFLGRHEHHVFNVDVMSLMAFHESWNLRQIENKF